MLPCAYLIAARRCSTSASRRLVVRNTTQNLCAGGRTTVGTADLPANARPKLQDDATRRDQLPTRRVALCLTRRWLHVKQGAVGELAAQLTCLAVDVGIVHRP